MGEDFLVIQAFYVRNEINSPVQERKIQNEQIDKLKDSTSNKVGYISEYLLV